MDDTDVQIGIEITSELQGAQDAEKAIGDVSKSAKESAAVIEQSYSELEDRARQAAEQFGKVTPTPEGIKGFEFLSDAAKKALGVVSDGADHAELSHEQLKRSISGLGRLFPELHHLAHAAFHPITLLIAATVVVIHRVVDGFKEMAKVLALPEWKNNADVWKTYDTGLLAARTQAAIFQITLRGIADTNALLQRSADEVTAALQRQQTAQVAIRSAEEALALAKVDALAKLGPDKGGISEIGALEKKLALQKQFAADAIAADKKSRDEQAENLKARVAADEFNKRIVEQRVAEAEAEVRRVGVNQTITDKLAQQEANVTNQTKKVKELEETYKSTEGVLNAFIHPINKFNQQALEITLPAAKDLLELYQNQLLSTKQLVQSRAVQVAEAEKARDSLQAQLTTLKSISETNEHNLQLMIKQNLEADKQAVKLDAINAKRREVEAFPERAAGAVKLQERAGEISQQYAAAGVEFGTKAGRDVGYAVQQALKEAGVSMTDAIVPVLLDYQSKSKTELKAYVDQVFKTSRGAL